VHHGPFMGIPATGKSATVSGIDIHLLRNGKLAEHWDVVDILSLLQQLGAFPQPN
jgi:predicted ester cyclase